MPSPSDPSSRPLEHLYDLLKGEAPDGGSQPVQAATVPVSSAELLALTISPKELIASPGAGKMIVPIFMSGQVFPGATPYGDVDAHVYIGNAAVGWADFFTNIFSSGGESISSDLAVPCSTPNPSDSAFHRQPNVLNFRDVAVSLMNDGDPLTDGDGTLLVTVLYIVLDVPS